jgi:hypothetical protein
MNTYIYEHMHIHIIFISTSKKLSRLDFEIYKVGH